MKHCFLLFLFASLLGIQACDDGEDPPKTTINGFILESASIAEGSTNAPKSLTIQVDGEVHTSVTVSYSIQEETAKFGQDLENTSGEFELTHDNSEAQISIPIIGDQNLELSETFKLVLTYDQQEYPLTVTIRDDDSMPAIQEDADGFFTPDNYPSMTLAWSDEFGGTQLSSTNWSYELGNGCPNVCGWGNNELENYTNSPNNSKVENGMLTITAIEDNGQYTSARIKTQGKVRPTFGRIDIRAKLPKGKGIWPALWMLGESITTVNWPACGEVDIMELVGHEPAKVHGTVHYDNAGYKSSTGSTSLSSGDFSDKFHVFSIVWDRDKITWYVDNTSFKSFSRADSSYPFNTPFFFIFNVAVGGNWPGSPDATTVFPQQMVVDYIRVFQ